MAYLGRSGVGKKKPQEGVGIPAFNARGENPLTAKFAKTAKKTDDPLVLCLFIFVAERREPMFGCMALVSICLRRGRPRCTGFRKFEVASCAANSDLEWRLRSSATWCCLLRRPLWRMCGQARSHRAWLRVERRRL